MYASDRKILSRLSLLTKLRWGLVERLSVKSLKWKKNFVKSRGRGNKRKTQAKAHKFTARPPPSFPSLVDRVGHHAIPQKELKSLPLSLCLM